MSSYFLVQAGFGSPQRQNRWGVAFRLILAVPLMLWLFLLSIAASVLILVGWFAALILGRLPRSFVKPLSDFIIYVTRVYSYCLLMNSAYPPFSANRDFAVNVDIPRSDVRRWAVLFRIILLIPAAIVSTLLSLGTQVAIVFIWLIVLVKGEMPLSLFGALAAMLRFEARFYAYYMMITSSYPGELFGDAPLAEQGAYGASIPDAPTAGEASAPTLKDGHGTDVSSSELPSSGFESAMSPGADAPSGAPLVFDADKNPWLSAPPKTARLVLSRASKRILVALLILGGVGYVADILLQAQLHNNASALSTMTNANNELNGNIAIAKEQQASCTLGADACQQQYFALTAGDFTTFQSTLDGTAFPSGAQHDATVFKSTTITQSQINRLQSLGNTWDTDFSQVMSDLTSPL
jgi:hypothetical protein